MGRFILQTFLLMLLSGLSAAVVNAIALKRDGRAGFDRIEAGVEVRNCDQIQTCPRKLRSFPYPISWNWLPLEAHPPSVKGYSFVHLQEAHGKYEKGRAQFLDARPIADVLESGRIQGAFPLYADFAPVSAEAAELGTEFDDCFGIYQYLLQSSGLDYIAYCYGGECDDSKVLTCSLSNRGIGVENLFVMKENLHDWKTRYGGAVDEPGQGIPPYLLPSRLRGWRTLPARALGSWLGLESGFGSSSEPLLPRDVLFLDVRSPEAFAETGETLQGAEFVNPNRIYTEPGYLDARIAEIRERHPIEAMTVAIGFARLDPIAAYEVADALHRSGLGYHPPGGRAPSDLDAAARRALLQLVVLRETIEDWFMGDLNYTLPREMITYPMEQMEGMQ